MGNIVFNVAKGRANGYVATAIAGTGGAKIRMLALKASAADATTIDYDTLSAVLGDAGTTEADFTNYARKDLTASLSRVVDDTGDEQYSDAADQTWFGAGGATNNTLTDLVIYFDPDGTDTDSASVPLTQHDFVLTTDGNDVAAVFVGNGWYGAT